jgi:acyl-coenzyme A synthetase/AMP-(fatty) acid ligase
MNGANLLVAALENEGVKQIFGVPGEENLDVVEALRRSTIKFVATRHEQAAAFMAATHGQKGDRVTIYLPMILEAAIAMLACPRIGAIHSVVFGGFSPDSLVGRIKDCRSTVLITADQGRRGGRAIPLKRNADNALRHCLEVRDVVVVRHTGGNIDWVKAAISGTTKSAPPPRPIVRQRRCRPRTRSSSSILRARPDSRNTTGGYLVYTSMTHEYFFDYREGEVYCAPPTSVGSPGTATSCTDRSPTARPP